MAFSTHDQVTDSPTNVFATFNPLWTTSVVNNGNLSATTDLSGTGTCYSSIAMESGKYYWEVLIVSATQNPSRAMIGIALDNSVFNLGAYVGSQDNQYSYWGYNGKKYVLSVGSTYGSTYGANNIIGVFLDLDAGELTFLKDNVTQGVAFTSLSGRFHAGISDSQSTSQITFAINFGQDPSFGGAKSPSSTYTDANGIGSFYYQPPTGALALCTANLPDPDIDPALDDLPEDYFKAVTYAGSIGNDQLVDCGFPADLIWIKGRTASYTTAHMVYDTIRGRTSLLQTNNTDAEYDYGNLAPTISTSTTSINGFKTPPTANNNINASANTYVAWFFRAGGAPTADNSNTSGAMTANSVSVDGTLQSSYTPSGSPTIYPTRMSVNTKAGFSIVKVTKSAAQYSYDTYPHGLSKAPDFIITKSLNSSTEHWYCYHSSITPNTGYSARIQLNQLNQATLNSTIWGSPTNITDNIIAWDGAQNLEQIFYCWYSVAGYSKFSSYVGNGSTNGPFVYTGFKPAWVMIKRTDTGGQWFMFDNKRLGYNSENYRLMADSSDAESDPGEMELLSNGFKLRFTSGNVNGSGGTYIYAAFAEMPFKYANAR